jgi:hypothetical protein
VSTERLSDADLDRIEKAATDEVQFWNQGAVADGSDVTALVAEVKYLRVERADVFPPPGSTWVDADGRSWLVGHPAVLVIDGSTGETQWASDAAFIRNEEKDADV